ncbi:aminoglycoside 3'-phosphotransferase/choline kinase family protein [soil metagenome]
MNLQELNYQANLPHLHSFEEYEHFKLNTHLLEKAVNEVIQRHELKELPLILFSEGTNIVFAHGKHRVIKIFPPFHQEQFKSELLVLQHLQGKLSVQTPIVEYYGEISDWPYIVMTQLEGTILENLWEKIDHSNKIIIIRELGALIQEVHALSTDGLEAIDCHWEIFIKKQIAQCMEQHRSAKLPEFLLQQISNYLEPIKESLSQITKPVLLTGEYTPMNFLVNKIAGIWHIAGLIDFGDAMLGLPEYDLLGPGDFLIQGNKELLTTFLTAYGYLPEIMTAALSHKLTALTLLHQYSNLNVQIRIKDWQSRVSNMKDLENLLWGF